MDRWKNYRQLDARLINPGRRGQSRGGFAAAGELPLESLDAYTVICFGACDDETYRLVVLADSSEHAIEQAHGAGHRPRSAFLRDPRVRARRWLDGLRGWRAADRCINCGYSLDGLAMVRGRVQCPECGGRWLLFARRPPGKRSVWKWRAAEPRPAGSGAQVLDTPG